jgi:hypothetical protein
MSILGIMSTVSQTLKDAIGDRDGRLHVVTGGTPVIFSTTGAAAISLTTSIGANYHRPSRLKRLAVTFSAAPTTSESLTVTHTVYASGSRPSPVIYTVNPAALGATSIVYIWEGGYELGLGDELVLAYTNTNTKTIKAELVLEVL